VVGIFRARRFVEQRIDVARRALPEKADCLPRSRPRLSAITRLQTADRERRWMGLSGRRDFKAGDACVHFGSNSTAHQQQEQKQGLDDRHKFSL
jgi:hypothetical protein